MRYLVTGSEGPGFASPREAIEVLKKEILPTRPSRASRVGRPKNAMR